MVVKYVYTAGTAVKITLLIKIDSYWNLFQIILNY